MSHITENHDALLDYLYEEGNPAERLSIAKHLQECAACAVAVLEFQNVRGMLGDWTPPASPSLRATVPAPSASVTSPDATLDSGARGGLSWGWGPTTTKEKSWWGRGLQAAAAILLFVSGMAFSQLDFDYRGGVVIVRTPSAAPGTPSIRNASSITLPPQPASSGPVAAVNIDEIVRQVRSQLEAENASFVDGERLLQRVRAMIDQSEQRQHRELALRLSQVAREVDAQHRVDVERIQQDFGKQQEATMEYLVRTSGAVK